MAYAQQCVSIDGQTLSLALNDISSLMWSTTGTASSRSYDLGIGKNAAGIAEIHSGTPGIYRDLKLRNLIATGRVDLPQYTTATRPAWVNGAQIFDTDLDKQLIGGVSAWEVVTSS